MTAPFPKSPTFMTIDEPFRFEGDLYDLEVEGTIPPELDGTFFRVGPDQAFPPMLGDANPFNGDRKRSILTQFRHTCRGRFGYKTDLPASAEAMRG